MQIFEQKYHGRIGRQRSERITHLAQHAILRGADRFLLQLLERSGGSKSRRELHTPRGRVSAKHVGHSITGHTVEQATGSFQKRQVSFAGPVLLYAAAPRNKQTGIFSARSMQELVRECCLPDARLAGDENDLPVALERLTQRLAELLQFRLAAHE